MDANDLRHSKFIALRGGKLAKNVRTSSGSTSSQRALVSTSRRADLLTRRRQSERPEQMPLIHHLVCRSRGSGLGRDPCQIKKKLASYIRLKLAAQQRPRHPIELIVRLGFPIGFYQGRGTPVGSR